uniref:Venom lipase 1 n=1 Tax=Oncocephalus sp. TaxID=2944721 RepID=A0AB38ZEP9_9HEMI
MKSSYTLLYLLSCLFLIILVAAKDDCKDGKCKDKESWTNWLKRKAQGMKLPTLGIHLPDFSDKDEDKILVRFYLYTRQTLNNPEEYIVENNQVPMFTHFDTKKPTRIIVHGWMGSGTSKFSLAFIDAYLPKFDYNLIVVDWGGRAKKFYPTARQSIVLIGKYLSDFIDRLCQSYNIPPESLHVVGHSLGAHVAGIAGRFIQSGKLGRISGLDPAHPFFTKGDNDMLTTKAALFVDVIHTCGRYLGWYDQIGHADFYPNKGIAMQPGCGTDVIGKCSHRRAWEYYAESIGNPKTFMAYACISWDVYEQGLCRKGPVPMGEYLPTDTRGTFYLKTNSEGPYGRGLNDLID